MPPHNPIFPGSFSSFTNLPSELLMQIRDISENEVKLQIIHSEPYKIRPFRYSVTGLTGCVRKYFWQRINPKPLSWESRWNFARGKLFDAMVTSCFTLNQERVLYECKQVPCIISGRYDNIEVVNGQKIIVDAKTTGKNLDEIDSPPEQYMQQVRFYAIVTHCDAAKIRYINMMGIKDVIVVIGKHYETLDFFEKQAVYMYNAEKYGILPLRQESGLCNYCDYQQECGAVPQ
jgi:hypothetical protein